MAETKRVYEIRINGIQESFEGVKSLREALDGLSDTVVTVNKEETKSSETRKTTASTTDALAKAQEKLNNYDKQYQEELAKVNASLSANKKEINDAIKLQQAQDTVDAKQLDTYAQKQQYLSALNTLIRNHSTATEADAQAVDRMVQESAELQAELKAADEQMQIYVRNVGNYQGAADTMIESHKGIKQELKDIKTEMAEMLANGVSKTDEGYLKLAERAGQLKDALGDANKDIANFASDTQGLSNAINLASSAVNAYQLYNSTMELFGAGNKEAAESMKKMMAVMTVLNSLQRVQNSLLENGSATARIYHKSLELVKAMLGLKKKAVEDDKKATEESTRANEENQISQEESAAAKGADATATQADAAAKQLNSAASNEEKVATEQSAKATQTDTTSKQLNEKATNKMSVAQKAGAVASKTLSTALRAIPLLAIIGLVTTLISNWESIWNWFKKTFPLLEKLSKKFDEMGGFMNVVKGACIGLGKAIVGYVTAPIKGMADAIAKFIKGDFKGAVQSIKNIANEWGKVWGESLKAGSDAIQEGITQKHNEEQLKQADYELEMLEARLGNEAKYSKKGQELQKKIFKTKREMAKGDVEAQKQLDLDEANYYRECQEYKTKVAKQSAKERAKAEKEAAKAAKEAAKEEEDRVKELSDLHKENEQNIKASDKLWVESKKKQYKIEDELLKRQVTQANETREATYQANLEQAKTIRNYEMQIAGLKLLKQAQENIFKKNGWPKLGEDIEKTTDELKKAEDALAAFLKSQKVVVKRVNGEIVGELGWTDRYKFTLQTLTDEIEAFFAKRTELAVNTYLFESEATRQSMHEQIKANEETIKKMEEAKKKARTKKEKDTIDIDISNAQLKIKTLRTSLAELYGDYSGLDEENNQKKDINIPLNLDIEGAIDKMKQFTLQFQMWGEKVPFTLNEFTQFMFGVTEKTSKDVRTIQEIWDGALESGKDSSAFLLQTLQQFAGLTEDEYKELYGYVEEKQPFTKIGDRLTEMLTKNTINLAKFGKSGFEVFQLLLGMQEAEKTAINNAYKDYVNKQNQIISSNEKIVKSFQDATKELKFEPVMTNDVLSGWIKGQIMDLDKTRERYDDLLWAYEEYLDAVTPGSEQMKKVEEAWQLKLEATKQHYGENSNEYKLMVEEKRKSDAAYAMEYEKAQQKVDEITEKSKNIMYDYIESLSDRFKEIYSTFSENMFEPLAEGFGALLDFQLEEAQEALEKVEELYDKAVEAKQESANRMKKINDELRNDDGANKEALQQRLAEEEVLLVQREEAERALQKEKEKREKDVQRKEAQQRVLELSQKLVEGIANTALGATAALKYGFPLGPVFAAIITAMGALQTAIISKQIAKAKSQMAHGGVVGEDGISRSHKQGGHKIEDTNIEVEGGEWVVNKKSSQKYDSLLRAINDDNIGLVRKQVEIIRERRIVNNTNQIAKFASGGQINTLTATNAVRENNEIAAITELIKAIDFQPTVSVVDINKVSKRLVRVQDLSGKAV